MLGTVERTSNNAQNMISRRLVQLNSPDSQEHQDLIILHKAYTKINELIQTAKNQHATAGAYILSYQLSQSEQELNAAELLRNFLTVLDYPVETTFALSREPAETSCIDTAKLFSMCPLIFMVVICAAFPPMIFMSIIPGIMLTISALPLAITYAFDEPFSMSRFYQEMAGIEKALAYSAWLTIVPLLVAAATPGIPLLAVSIAFLSVLSTGLAFYLHSENLQSKHVQLKAVTNDIVDVLHLRNNNYCPSLSFFKAAENDLLENSHLSEMKQALSGINAM